jgi:hypothetical protein
MRPTRAEKAASAIFNNQMRYMMQNDYLGFNGVVITDNVCADSFRSLRELDLLATISTVTPLASRSPLSKLHYLEVWDLLTRRGRLIGVWARRIPIAPVGVEKRSRFSFGLGVDWKKDKQAIISSCLTGLESLVKDPSTSLSGLPAKADGENIYAVVGDVSESTFQVIEAEWQSQGVCLYAPAPRLKNIYLIRLANVDEDVFRQDLGLDGDSFTQKLPRADFNDFDFGSIFGQLARRADMTEEEFRTIWKKEMEV